MSSTEMPAWHESTRRRLRSSFFQVLAQTGYVEKRGASSKEYTLLPRLYLRTIRRLCPEFEHRAEFEEMSYRDYLAVPVAEEVAHRTETRIQRATRKANFSFLRTIEEFDFRLQTAVCLSLLGSYLGPELVSEGRCLILGGNVGTCKAHLAVSIACRAIQNQLRKTLTPYLQAHVLVTMKWAT